MPPPLKKKDPVWHLIVPLSLNCIRCVYCFIYRTNGHCHPLNIDLFLLYSLVPTGHSKMNKLLIILLISLFYSLMRIKYNRQWKHYISIYIFGHFWPSRWYIQVLHAEPMLAIGLSKPLAYGLRTAMKSNVLLCRSLKPPTYIQSRVSFY